MNDETVRKFTEKVIENGGRTEVSPAHAMPSTLMKPVKSCLGKVR